MPVHETAFESMSNYFPYGPLKKGEVHIKEL